MSGRSSSGAVGKLGRHETLYDFRLAEQLDTAKHFFTYDRSSIHRPPQTPSNTSTPASDAVTTVAKDPEPTRQQIPVRNPTQQRLRKRIEDKFADLPPLQEEEDDEDTEDRQAVARYSKESNNWLLFAGVFALLTTIFITSFTLLPHQIASRQANLEMLANLARPSCHSILRLTLNRRRRRRWR
ncbi:hypothetical protein BDW22DRAFT_910726 [Trametopsis cervina]|nr:hypothetical protein BDW22DRAFT_910726 [Trametopsis cervina]